MSRLPLALTGLLAMAVAVEALAPAPAVTVPAPLGRVASSSAAIVVPTGDTSSWQATILARPLFRPDRRPLSAAPVVAATALPRLTAIVMTAAGATAIFDGDDGKPVIVAAGSDVDGYKVQSIGRDRVELEGAGGRTVLQPQFGTPPVSSVNGAAPLALPPRLSLENE